MANTILTKKQLPGMVVYTDAANTFTQPQYLPSAEPVAGTEAVTKDYVDGKITSASTGLQVKNAARVGTTATTGTYTATAGTSARGQITAAPNTVDGITLLAGNRVLVKNHATIAANGIYVVSTVGTGATGIWDRAEDFNSDLEASPNSFVFLEEGNTLGDTAWVLTTNAPITLGGASGTGLVWTQFAGSGVGISTVGIATANGLQGTSSGGYTPTITLGTPLVAGNVKSNGSGAFIVGAVDLSGAEVTNTLPVARGGTGATTFSAGLVYANGTTAHVAASAAQIVAAIGATAVTNSVNSDNILVVNDVATAVAVYPTFVTAISGDLPVKVASTKLSFVPSTGILTATGFAGSAAGLTGIPAAQITGTIPTATLGSSTLYVGTTAVALNRASANQGLTGILSVIFNGATSGTTQIMPVAVAGANNILYLPLVAGTLVSTGDTGTVTNTMLAGAIADSKLNQITTAAKVSTASLTGTLFTLGSTAVAALSTVNTIAGMVSITSSTFVGSLTGNASGTSSGFTGTLGGEVTGSQSATVVTNAAVIGKVITGFTGAAGTVTASDSVLSAINKLSGNIALKEDAISSTNYKVGVAVTGAANGTNLVFTLPNAPAVSTEMVFVNGVLQQRGAGNDYQIAGNTVTFETGNAPQVGAILVATYFV